MSSEASPARLTVRLRVASPNQLGGHTARPQAPSDSLGSVQVHESAINNALDQLHLASRTFTLPELYQHLARATNIARHRRRQAISRRECRLLSPSAIRCKYGAKMAWCG